MCNFNKAAVALAERQLAETTSVTTTPPSYLTDRTNHGTIPGLDYNMKKDGTLWLTSENGSVLRIDGTAEGGFNVFVHRGPVTVEAR